VTRALVIIVALVACSDRKAPSPPPTAATNAVVKKQLVIPSTSKQLIIAVIDDWSSTHARVSLWQRKGTWQKLDEWPATIGRRGAAWGIGLHPAREAPIKKEGDGKSPAGVFTLRKVYGYAADAPPSWRMPYESAVDLECINDPSSDHYTQIVDRKQVPSDWQSAELMRRDDKLYTWVVDIAHNPEAKRSAGSCIFLHVWGGPESATDGCTAMEKKKLEAMLDKLDPGYQPLFVLLPQSEYRAVADAWGLPAL
jgi:zinc D-Ala-D-Ala dipeptidase